MYNNKLYVPPWSPETGDGFWWLFWDRWAHEMMKLVNVQRLGGDNSSMTELQGGDFCI